MKCKAWFSKWLLKFLYGTCRWDVKGRNQIEELIQSGKAVIVASWHGKLLPVFMNLSSCNYHALAGMHKDAELISQIGAKMGWKLLRGSSSDRGKEVFKEIVSVLSKPGEVFGITPDGPKGPPNEVKNGIVKLASLSGCKILPLGFAIKNSFELSTWDRTVIPLPFSKLSMNYGEPISVPRKLKRNELENYTIQIHPYNQLPEQVHLAQAAQDSAKVPLQALHVDILHLRAEKQVCLSMLELLFPQVNLQFCFWNNFLLGSLIC